MEKDIDIILDCTAINNFTSSIVILACGLLSLLYCTTPAKLLARVSKKFAISKVLSIEFSIGSHNLRKKCIY